MAPPAGQIGPQHLSMEVFAMGYTHYWTIEGGLSPAEMAGFSEDARRIIEAAGKAGPGAVQVCREYDSPDEPPQLDADLVAYNGPGEEGHETFYIEAGRGGFAFCKTARKPYDVIVTACLIALRSRVGPRIRVTSDGDADDWQLGYILATRALGQMLTHPATYL